jgi:hypothetical protein
MKKIEKKINSACLFLNPGKTGYGRLFLIFSTGKHTPFPL